MSADTSKLLLQTQELLEKVQAAYQVERKARMEAEQAADTLYEALNNAECRADCRRAVEDAEKRWPWLG